MNALVPCLLLSLAVVSALPAGADVIFDQGLPHASPFSGLLSDTDGDNQTNSSQQIAENFSLAEGNSTVTDIHWWGAHWAAGQPQADDFYILFFQDNGGLPGTELASYHPGAVTRAVFDLGYAYEWDLPAPLALAPGTTYWISIQNDLDGDGAWYWASVGTPGGSALSHGSVWATLGETMAFQLTGPGVVPEPGTLSLVGLGLSLAAARRLRRQRR